MNYTTISEVPVGNLKLLPQGCIKSAYINDSDNRNAIWDMLVTKNGRCFFSVCAELFVSESAGLYEYKYDTNEIVCCFELDKCVCTYKDAIMPSKIHTSMAEMNDGRLIMATHTTAQSKKHPYWYAEPFYNHVFEGYQGSNILIYNPDNRTLENRGIPVPHESIYGGAYDPIHNSFYFTGYFRGHLYRYDVDDGGVTDYGKVTEFGTFRLFRSSIDGNIYSASRSGRMYRINCEKQVIEEIGVFFDKDYEPYSTEKHVQLDYITDGVDGKIYFRYIFGMNIYRYNPKTNEVENLGNGRPKSVSFCHPAQQYGLCCDERGVLWYTVSNRSEKYDWTDAHLVRWDVLNGKEPENMGLVGTLKQTVNIAAEMHCKSGILFITNGNHYFDVPGMVAIDLKKLESTEYNLEEDNIDTPMSKDLLNYMHLDDPKKYYPYGKAEYERQLEKAESFRKYGEKYGEFISENPFDFPAKKVKAYAVWKFVKREESYVREVFFEGEHIKAIFGNESVTYLFDSNTQAYVKTDTCKESTTLVTVPNDKIPSACGRRFKAVITADVKISSNRYLVGTQDGLLFLWDGENAFNLGCCPNCSGEIRKLCYCEKTSTAYGIAGSENDICIIFSYDDKNGVKYMGRAHFCTDEGLFSSCNLSSIDVNQDGTRLAVGAYDEMGTVYDITL